MLPGKITVSKNTYCYKSQPINKEVLLRNQLTIEQVRNNKKGMFSAYKKPAEQHSSQQWKMALISPRLQPGHGLLPAQPALLLQPDGPVRAIEAALRLLTPVLPYSGVSRASPTPDNCVSFMKAPEINQPQAILRVIDQGFDNLLAKMLPWQGVKAQTGIWIELDTLDQWPASPESVSTLSLAQQEINAEQQRIQNRNAYQDVVNKIRKGYPQLYELAAGYLKLMIRTRYGLELNPDTTWFLRFDFAASSSETFTGWEHVGPPKEAKTLTAILLENFSASDQLNADVLKLNAGIYTEGPTADHFGKNNEVRLLPEDFLNIVKESNFSHRFLRHLGDFWHTNAADFRTMCKGQFIALLGEERNALSEEGLQSVMLATLGDVNHLTTMSMEELERLFSDRGALSVSTFTLYGYIATDMILINGFNHKVILYMPSDGQNFFEFNNHNELKNWVVRQASQTDTREALASHFSLIDCQDSRLFSGVSTALERLGRHQWDTRYINDTPQRINQDLFSWITAQAESRTMRDVETLTTCDGEILKDKILMSLKPAAEMANVVLVVLPGVGSLALFEIGVVQAELGTYQAIYGDTEAQRDQGFGHIVDGGINALFGAAGVAENFGKKGLDIGEDTLPEQKIHNMNPSPSATGAATKPRTGGFWNILCGTTKVHARGDTAIARYNRAEANIITDTLFRARQTLEDAEKVLKTPKGETIVGWHLGYAQGFGVAETEIRQVETTLQALKEKVNYLLYDELSIERVSIFDPKRVNVPAYYSPGKKVMSFADRFFGHDMTLQKQQHILLHETMHAAIKEGGKAVPDFFYLRDENVPEALLNKRNEALEIARGTPATNFLTSHRGLQIKNNFLKKMGTESERVAMNTFFEDAALRREILLKNPDSQAILMMELGGSIIDDMQEVIKSRYFDDDGILYVPAKLRRPVRTKRSQKNRLQ